MNIKDKINSYKRFDQKMILIQEAVAIKKEKHDKSGEIKWKI